MINLKRHRLKLTAHGREPIQNILVVNTQILAQQSLGIKRSGASHDHYPSPSVVEKQLATKKRLTVYLIF
jgi:hypothetical protein